MTRTDYSPEDFETDNPEVARADRLGLTPATEQRTPKSTGLNPATSVELTDGALEELFA
jgi:hypothetical protein